MTGISERPPGVVSLLAIASGAIVMIPSLTALAFALFAVAAGLL